MARGMEEKNPGAGMTLVELLVTIALVSVVVALVFQVTAGALDVWKSGRDRSALMAEATFAMERMVRSVRDTKWIFLPLDLSDPTDPLYPGQSYFPTSFLAVSAGVDNDGDGAVDEDPGDDISGDNLPGIGNFDDDGDGLIDEGTGKGYYNDDDEDDLVNEDVLDGVDNDGDGRIDEDPAKNFFGIRGKKGIDDDGDGVKDEDPCDPLLFYLNGSNLMERHDVLGVTTSETVLAEHVREFRVLRRRVNGQTLIDLHLLLDDGRETVELNTTALALMKMSL